MSRNVTPPSQGWALVTGASSGIGLQYARQLAGRGYALVIVSNEAERIVEVGEELQKEYNVKVIALYRDLSLPDAARELFTYCEENHLAIEVLINNAGVFFFNDVVEVETRRIELMLDLHVRTVTLMCHYFGGAMKKRGKGYKKTGSPQQVGFPFLVSARPPSLGADRSMALRRHKAFPLIRARLSDASSGAYAEKEMKTCPLSCTTHGKIV